MGKEITVVSEHTVLRGIHVNLVRGVLQAIQTATTNEDGTAGEGYPISMLKEKFQKLGVPVHVAEAIERRLKQHGLITESNGRFYFTATEAHFRKVVEKASKERV